MAARWDLTPLYDSQILQPLIGRFGFPDTKHLRAALGFEFPKGSHIANRQDILEKAIIDATQAYGYDLLTPGNDRPTEEGPRDPILTRIIQAGHDKNFEPSEKRDSVWMGMLNAVLLRDLPKRPLRPAPSTDSEYTFRIEPILRDTGGNFEIHCSIDGIEI